MVAASPMPKTTPPNQVGWLLAVSGEEEAYLRARAAGMHLVFSLPKAWAGRGRTTESREIKHLGGILNVAS